MIHALDDIDALDDLDALDNLDRDLSGVRIRSRRRFDTIIPVLVFLPDRPLPLQKKTDKLPGI